MGFFDLFKKKSKGQENSDPTNQPAESSPYRQGGREINDLYADQTEKDAEEKLMSEPGRDKVYAVVKKYSEYVVTYIGMQCQGNYSPIAAYENMEGELTGFLYMCRDRTYNSSVAEAINSMEDEFEKRMSADQLASYAIFYHSQFAGNGNHSIAEKGNDYKAISVKYKTVNGISGCTALPYSLNNSELSFKGFYNFTKAENKEILETRLEEGKNYFQEMVEMKQEAVENEAGIKVKQANAGSLGDMWGGIFGFSNMENIQGRQMLLEYSAYVLSRDAIPRTSNISTRELRYGNIIFRGVAKDDDSMQTVYPLLKTDYYIDFETKEISEWSHVDRLEAVVTGNGRDTFGLSFFAADYGWNRDRYLAEKKLIIEVSAILYVLDVSNPEQFVQQNELKFSEAFTGYMPNKEMAGYGCFDFIGLLEDFQSIQLFDDKSITGYILKVKLITHEDAADFFTIDMFVNSSNMRFEKLHKGMKVSGLFQLTGQIKD